MMNFFHVTMVTIEVEGRCGKCGKKLSHKPIINVMTLLDKNLSIFSHSFLIYSAAHVNKKVYNGGTYIT